MIHPRARTSGLIVERVGEELVVYDELTQAAHSLTAELSAVWTLCDGRLSPGDIAAQTGLEPARLARAVAELEACGLLEGTQLSRRRLFAVGGAGLVAPLIYSVAIRPAMAAASAGITYCTSNCSDYAQINASVCSGASPGSYGTTSACTNTTACYESHSGNYYCAPSGCHQYAAQCNYSIYPPATCCAGNGVCTSGYCYD